MFGKILEFLSSLFARLFRKADEVDRGVDEPEDEDEGNDLLVCVARNRTSLAVSVDDNAERPGFTLTRGEERRVELALGEEVQFRDVVTGVVIGSAVVERADVSEADAVLTIDNAALAMTDVPGAKVRVALRNRTPFDLRILDDTGWIEERCPRRHTVTIESWPHRMLRALTDNSQSVRRTAGAGEVPLGLELGRFVVGTEPVTHEIENTVIGLENTTGSELACRRIGPGREVLTDLLLGSHDYVLAENYTADEWEVSFGGPVLQHVPRSWEAKHVRIDVKTFPLPADGAEQRIVAVDNALPLKVDLHERGASGHWTAAGTCAPGELTSVTTTFGAVLRATERRSGVVLSERPVDQPQATTYWRIDAAAPVDHTSRIEISNETHMDTWVVDLSSRDVQRLGPHGQLALDASLGSAVALAGLEPATDAGGRATDVDGVIGIRLAERAQPVLRPTSAELRGGPDAAPLRVTVQNLTGVPADFVDVDEKGVAHPRGSLVRPDTSASFDTEADRIVRLVRHGTGEILFETIATPAQTQLRAALGSHPAGPRLATVLVNRTLLDLVLKVLDDQGRIAPATEFELGPGESVDLPESAGWSHVVVEKRSGLIVHAFVIQRGVSVVEVTSQRVRSSYGADAALMLENRSGHLVRVVMVDPDGTERWVAILPEGGDESVTYAVGAYLRAYVGDPATVIAEHVVATAGERWKIELGFVRKVTSAAGAKLQTGELLVAPPTGVSGPTYVIDRSITSPDLVAPLDLRIGTLRVGPHTVATTRCTTTAGAEREIRMTTDSSLPDEVVGATITRVQVARLLDASEIGIAVRSHLVEEYRDPKHGGTVDQTTGLVKKKAYRTSLTLPPSVTAVDLAPVEENASVDLLHENEIVTATAAEPARLRPNALGKVQFSTVATDLSTPALLAQTNTLPAGVQVQIFPDSEAHQKLVALPDGEVARRRGELGLGHLAEDDCHAVQKVLQNLASTVQHSHAPASHGIDHKRRLGPEKMSHPHWQLTPSPDGSGGAVFAPLTKAEATARRDAMLNHSAAISADALGGFLGILVHTADNLGKDASGAVKHAIADVGETVHKIARDAETTASTVADDLRRGDVRGALTAAARGTVSIAEDTATGALRLGGDLVDGAAHLLEDVAEGAAQLAVATIQLAGRTITLVLDTVEKVAEAIGHVLQAIGSSIEHALGFLASLLPLDGVFAVHDAMVASMSEQVMDDRMRSWVEPIRTAIDGVFENLHGDIATLRAASHPPLDNSGAPQSALPPHHSVAKDTVDWVMSHVFHPEAEHPDTPETSEAVRSSGDRIQDDVESHSASGPVHKSVPARLDVTIQKGLADPTSIGPALLEVALDVADDAVGLVQKAVDGALEAFEHLPGAVINATAGPVTIPVVGSLYQHRTGSQPTVLGITCLAAAVSAGFDSSLNGLDWQAALTHVDPASAAVSPTSQLPPRPSDLEILLATAYCSSQGVAGLLELIPDPPPDPDDLPDPPPDPGGLPHPPGSTIEMQDVSDIVVRDPNDIELEEIGDPDAPAPTTVGRRGVTASGLLTGAQIVLGGMAVGFSFPPALWAGRPPFFETSGKPKQDAPNYIGDGMFIWECVSWVIETVFACRGGEAPRPGLTPAQEFSRVAGVLLLIGTGVLTAAEIIKVNDPESSHDYKLWGHTEGGGVGLKTIHNVVGAAPYLVALATPPYMPRTLPRRILDCALVEADVALTIVRTAQHGLY